MARKMKKETGKDGEQKGVFPGIPGGDLRISELELSKLNLFDAQMGQMQMAIEKFKLAEQLKLIEHKQELDVIRSKQRDSTKSLREIIEQRNFYLVSIEQKYGIKMADYSVDDGGRLILVNPGEQTEKP